MNSIGGALWPLAAKLLTVGMSAIMTAREIRRLIDAKRRQAVCPRDLVLFNAAQPLAPTPNTFVCPSSLLASYGSIGMVPLGSPHATTT